jgi:hypothetical protein
MRNCSKRKYSSTGLCKLVEPAALETYIEYALQEERPYPMRSENAKIAPQKNHPFR